MSLPKFIKNLRNKVSKDNPAHEFMEGSLHFNNGLSYHHSYEHEGATYAEISANKVNSEKRNVLQINSSPDENENKALRLLFTDENGNVKEISNIYGEHFKPTPEDIGALPNNSKGQAVYIENLFTTFETPTFVQWGGNTLNTPYKANLTAGAEGFAIVHGDLNGWHTVVAWQKGGFDGKTWMHTVENGVDKGWFDTAYEGEKPKSIKKGTNIFQLDPGLYEFEDSTATEEDMLAMGFPEYSWHSLIRVSGTWNQKYTLGYIKIDFTQIVNNRTFSNVLSWDQWRGWSKEYNSSTQHHEMNAMKHYNYLSNIDILQWAHEQTVSCSFATNPTVTGIPIPGYWRGMLIYSSGDKAILLMGPNQLWIRCTNGTSWDGTVWTPLGGADNFLPLTGGIVSGQIASSNYDNYRIVATDPNTGEQFGSFFRNDGGYTYLLLTNPNDPYGGWSSLRPFCVNNHTGRVQIDNGLAVNGDIEGNLNGVLRPTGYGYHGLSYAQTDQTFNGNTGWCHYIIANHNDGATYYNVMLALPFWNVPMYRRQEGNNTTNLRDWQTFYTTENVTCGTGSASITHEKGIYIRY